MCSRVLLSAEDLDEVDEALLALLAATDATSIFIELNLDDPELGPCSSMMREVTRPGYNVDTEHWKLVPWSRMPDSFERLSRGEPFAFQVSSLGATERALYDEGATISELDVPFFTGGEWVGLLGLSDHEQERSWRPDEVGLLVTAAEMLGAFWERRAARQDAAAMVVATERALRYQRALFIASRALLSIPEELEAFDVALHALTEAAGVDHGFIQRNEEVAGVGLCSRSIYEVDLHDPAGTPHAYWELVPWSRMPNSYGRMSRGLAFAFTRDELGPVEQQLYREGPCPIASMIEIPIFVDGAWEGLISFADTSSVRQWAPEEMELLTTVADLIGVHWLRLRNQEQLAELLKAKDAFLASVSHELRTPLTVVVGMSAELRDRSDSFPPEMVQEFIDIIAQQSADLADIVDDLLVAARVDRDIHTSPSHIDVRIEVDSVIEALGMSHVAVDGTGVAWADPRRVRQVIRNLLTNAQRYGGPTVRVEILAVQDRSIIRVIDDGSGVGDDTAGVLFEPYQIGHREQSQPEAIGLGLSISMRLSRLMGGDLRYARERDRTVFALALPRRP